LAVTLAHWPFGRLANHLSVADSDDDPNDDGACILFTFAGQKSERASPKGKPFRRFLGSQLMINCPLQAPVQPPRKKEILVPFENQRAGALKLHLLIPKN